MDRFSRPSSAGLGAARARRGRRLNTKKDCIMAARLWGDSDLLDIVCRYRSDVADGSDCAMRKIDERTQNRPIRVGQAIVTYIHVT
jgi:hypothetical protein